MLNAVPNRSMPQYLEIKNNVTSTTNSIEEKIPILLSHLENIQKLFTLVKTDFSNNQIAINKASQNDVGLRIKMILQQIFDEWELIFPSQNLKKKHSLLRPLEGSKKRRRVSTPEEYEVREKIYVRVKELFEKSQNPLTKDEIKRACIGLEENNTVEINENQALQQALTKLKKARLIEYNPTDKKWVPLSSKPIKHATQDLVDAAPNHLFNKKEGVEKSKIDYTNLLRKVEALFSNSKKPLTREEIKIFCSLGTTQEENKLLTIVLIDLRRNDLIAHDKQAGVWFKTKEFSTRTLTQSPNRKVEENLKEPTNLNPSTVFPLPHFSPSPTAYYNMYGPISPNSVSFAAFQGQKGNNESPQVALQTLRRPETPPILTQQSFIDTQQIDTQQFDESVFTGYIYPPSEFGLEENEFQVPESWWSEETFEDKTLLDSLQHQDLN